MELKKRIMKRIYAIWFLKRIVPAVFLYAPFLLFIAVRETANEFFVTRIMDNFLMAVHNSSSGFWGAGRFAFSALANTPVFPTMIILVSLGVLAIVLRKLTRNLRQARLVKSY